MAMGAAKALQAAGRQGKAWEMHDAMFANNKALRRTDLERYAAEIGLDVGRFARDMDDPAVKEEVLADQRVAAAVGATGTPTLFVNGRKIVGVPALETLTEMVRQEIRRANDLLEHGTPISEVYEELSRQPE